MRQRGFSNNPVVVHKAPRRLINQGSASMSATVHSQSHDTDPDPASEAKKNESRRERFTRVVIPRVKSAAHAIHLVSYGGAKERYDYSVEDALALDKFLRGKLDESMAQFGVFARERSVVDQDNILQRVDEAITAAFAEAEAEIEATRSRTLEDSKKRVTEMQKKAIEQAEQAAMLMSEVERESAQEATKLLEETVEGTASVRRAALVRARKQVLENIRDVLGGVERKSEIEDLLLA